MVSKHYAPPPWRPVVLGTPGTFNHSFHLLL